MQHGSIINLVALGGFQEVTKHFSLPREAIDDEFISISNGSLKEEREIAQNGSHFFTIDGNSAEELSQENHINHKRYCEQGVLTDVVGRDGVDAIKEDSRRVLVQSAFGVSDEGDVLDDHDVVHVVAVRVQSLVVHDCVVHNSGLGGFFGLERVALLQVFAVIVAQVVIGHDGREFYAAAGEEIGHGGLEACLTRLEIRACHAGVILLGELHDGWVEGVLRTAVEVGHSL